MCEPIIAGCNLLKNLACALFHPSRINGTISIGRYSFKQHQKMPAPVNRPPRYRLRSPLSASLQLPNRDPVDGLVDDLSENGLCFSTKGFSEAERLPQKNEQATVAFQLGEHQLSLTGTAVHLSHRGGKNIVGIRLLQRLPTKVLDAAKALGAGGIAWKGNIAEVHGTLSGQMWREWLAATRTGCAMRLDYVTDIDTAGAALVMNSLDQGVKVTCPPGKVTDLLLLMGLPPSRLQR